MDFLSGKLRVLGIVVLVGLFVAACGETKSEKKEDEATANPTVQQAATATATMAAPTDETPAVTPSEVVVSDLDETAAATTAPSGETPVVTPSEVAVSAPGETPTAVAVRDPGAASQPNEELSQIWLWPEWGLSLKYPADWRVGFDQNIDFVLVGPTDTTSGESPYLLAQSGAPGPDQTFRQVMEQLASRDGATVIETTFAGVEGLRFEFQSEQADRYRITGFPSGGGDIVLLAAVAPADTWEVWGPVFDAILDGATLAPLELDAAFLDSQMQVSFEADGLLTVGDPAAPLWIVEFMDFSCSHCANYRAAIDRLAQDYVQTGKARLTLVVLDVIGLEPSALAATYQFCGAKQGVGWRIHEAIFGVFDRGQAYTDENLSAAVQNADLGLDLEAYGACLRDEAIHAIVAANDAWADSVGVDSTPTVMIGAQKDDLRFMLDSNGEKLAGEIPLYFVYGKLDEQLASLAPQPTPIRRLIGG